MLGMPNCKDELFVNHVLLIAKQFLCSCRCRKTFPLLKVFMSRLRKIKSLELVIARQKISYRFIQRNGAILTRYLCTEILLSFMKNIRVSRMLYCECVFFCVGVCVCVGGGGGRTALLVILLRRNRIQCNKFIIKAQTFWEI